jgi:hypothetical protein
LAFCADNASNNATLVKTLELLVKESCTKPENQISELFNADTCHFVVQFIVSIPLLWRLSRLLLKDAQMEVTTIKAVEFADTDINADLNLEVDAEGYSVLATEICTIH